MIELIDTHAHIHFDDYGLDPDRVLDDAKKEGVAKVILVSTDVQTSQLSVEFVQNRPDTFAAVGVHPHYAKDFTEDRLRQIRNLLNTETLQKSNSRNEIVNPSSPAEFSSRQAGTADALCPDSQSQKGPSASRSIVAIGECGLDYHYENSPREAQKVMLEQHLQLAREFGLPVIFHVRDGHEDFWPIFDNFAGIKGVMHSFSATEKELVQALNRGLYIGLNGIMTFTKDEAQLAAAKLVPKDKLLLETDAPYLTPNPFRGKICKPEHVRLTAEFLAVLRDELLEDLARRTTKNAKELFGL